VTSELNLSGHYFDEEKILALTNDTHVDIKVVCWSKQTDETGKVIFQSSVFTYLNIELRGKSMFR